MSKGPSISEEFLRIYQEKNQAKTDRDRLRAPVSHPVKVRFERPAPSPPNLAQEFRVNCLLKNKKSI